MACDPFPCGCGGGCEGICNNITYASYDVEITIVPGSSGLDCDDITYSPIVGDTLANYLAAEFGDSICIGPSDGPGDISCSTSGVGVLWGAGSRLEYVGGDLKVTITVARTIAPFGGRVYTYEKTFDSSTLCADLLTPQVVPLVSESGAANNPAYPQISQVQWNLNL